MSDTDAAQTTIGAYPMKACEYASFLDHAPFSKGEPRDEVDLMNQRRADRGRAYEITVFDELKATFGEDCVVIALTADERELPFAERLRLLQAKTLEAMRDGVRLICGGSLRESAPSAPGVFRTGDPDVLVLQQSDTLTGNATYLPVDVKNHKTLAKRAKLFARRAVVADLSKDPRTADFAQGLGLDPDNRRKDGLQLAHYTRMLEAMGFHPGAAQQWGGVIGSDPTTLGPQVTWIDMAEVKSGETLLSTYDASFKVRLEAIQNAQAGVRYPQTSAAGVRAGRFGKRECGDCGRRTVCKDDAGEEDASFLLTVGRPNRGGWEYLADQGAISVTALADLSVASHDGDYTAAAQQVGGKVVPLAEVVERARMHRDGELLRLLPSTPPPVPAFDVEIDFDIEWDEDQLVYQWGAVVRRDQDLTTETYEHSRYEFGPQTKAEADALAARFFANLDVIVAEAQAAGRSVGLFHWTPPEEWQTTKFIGENLTDRYGAGLIHDLQLWARQAYFSRDGFSLKKIAPACGFEWDVTDAGGDMSMVKIDEYRTSPDAAVREAAKQWLLSYNEADCRAQSRIRDVLRATPQLVAEPQV